MLAGIGKGTLKRGSSGLRRCSSRTPPVRIRQKHDYLTRAWRKTYKRRVAVERAFAMAKNKATIDMTKGFIRVQGIAKTQFMRTIGWAVVNRRLLLAFEHRQSKPPQPPPGRRPRRPQHYSPAMDRLLQPPTTPRRPQPPTTGLAATRRLTNVPGIYT
jgi:hypothetical protein